MKAQVQRLLGAVSLALTVGAVLAGSAYADRPDDRAGMLGVGAVSQSIVAPDVFERAVARAADERAAVPDAFERAVFQRVRPDDRGGIRGPGTAPTQTPSATVAGDGFQWSDAALGAAGALCLILLGGAATLTARHRAAVTQP